MRLQVWITRTGAHHLCSYTCPPVFDDKVVAFRSGRKHTLINLVARVSGSDPDENDEDRGWMWVEGNWSSDDQ